MPEVTYRVIVGSCDGVFENQYVYVDERNSTGTVATPELDARLDEVNHSPTGLSWGYRGSGPSQLAYALLRMVLPEAEARRLYTIFREEFVMLLVQKEDWELSESVLRVLASELQRRYPEACSTR